MRMLGSLGRPRAAETKIHRGFSLKKKERPTTTKHQGATGEDFQPSRSKIDENRPKNHQLADVMRMLGPLVRPRAAKHSFTRRFSLKKKERPTTGIHQGSTRDPPRIHQGPHFQGPCPLGCSLSRLIEGTRTADGTRDHDRV